MLAGVTGIVRAGRARGMPFDLPKQRVVTIYSIAGLCLG